MKEKTIDIPIYFGKLTIILTDSWSKVNLLYNTKIDSKLYDAVVFEIKDNDEYIVAIKKVEWSIIAHEVVHLVNAIFLKCGVELDRHNDEPQAYLTGWIINEIDKSLKQSIQVGDITEKGIVDTIGNCANCGVEFHIHKHLK